MSQYRIIENTITYNNGETYTFYKIEEYAKILWWKAWIDLSLLKRVNNVVNFKTTRTNDFYFCEKEQAEFFIEQLTECNKDNLGIVPIINNSNYNFDDFYGWYKRENGQYIFYSKYYDSAKIEYLNKQKREFGEKIKSHTSKICQ